MPFCVDCGYENRDGATFCLRCGKPFDYINNNEKRRTSYAGNIIKCPNCGEILSSYTSSCPSCGIELRNISAPDSINDLFAKLQSISNEKEKIQLLKLFPVPNSKEDICDFMILAVSNFDENYYADHLDEEDISDAWYSKIEQCYQKAKMTFPDSTEFIEIQNLYFGTLDKVKNAKNRSKSLSILPPLITILGILMVLVPITAVGYVGVVVFITGIILICVNSSKKAQKRINTNQTNYNAASTSNPAVNGTPVKQTGYASWSTGAKVGWVILNIYLVGIPAIIYVCCKKK